MMVEVEFGVNECCQVCDAVVCVRGDSRNL